MFPQEPSVPQISVDEVKKMIYTNEELVLLDVRTEGEVARGKLDGSINIPIDQIPAKVESMVADKNAKIIVYCLSGSRSVFAVEFMQKLGYKNVLNMTNGILAWRAKGFETTI
jgi:rhodanese-related sulfurtransferase